jgi:hypothetical protein
MKKNAMVLLFCIFFSAAAGAGSLEELAGAERVSLLESGDSLVETQLSAPAPRLAPHYPYLREILDTLFARLSPSMLVENLSLYRKPAGAGSASWTAAERTALYNRMLQVSSLAGLQYYSTSRRTMRTFYESSGVIDGPSTRRPWNDPSFETPPEMLELYTRQKDLTFGDNVYRSEYHALPGAIIQVQENVTPLTMSIITAVGQGRLRTVIAIMDAGPYLLVYGAAFARAASFPGLGSRISASFSTRVAAMARWFENQANLAFSESR